MPEVNGNRLALIEFLRTTASKFGIQSKEVIICEESEVYVALLLVDRTKQSF